MVETDSTSDHEDLNDIKNAKQDIEAELRKKWIINPYCKPKQAWDFLATVALVLTCLLTPYLLAFYTHSRKEPPYYKMLNSIIDIIFIIDIFVSFNTSYFD